MPETTTAATELTSQYISQVASDLERNVKEQERIASEMTTLQQQLAALQHDHTVLVQMQQALGVAATAPELASADSATVPSPRKQGTAKPRTRVKTTTTEKPAAKRQSAKGAVTKTAQPTLVELIRRHLTEQSEPRSAAEIATALSQAYPDRGIKTTVVRTSLENLVARNQAQRTKQASSVFYTAPNPPQPATAPQTETQPDIPE
ncbi:hypothetical protein ACQEV2_00055 [Streptomyces sp. CA-251387]|uniref:hypothetical protein n=1 Tax=Streptomyces sp. CA-251387 TaxID=3240064 RepID=UPI003D90AEDD